MEIYLNHIGIIKDSIIKLDGLTVITGKNNSGKTTVGKVLYSLVDGVCDIQRRSDADKKYYVIKQIEQLCYNSAFFSAMDQGINDDSFFEQIKTLRFFMPIHSTISTLKIGNIYSFTENFLAELKNVNVENIAILEGVQKFYISFLPKTEDINLHLEKEKKEAISFVEKLMLEISKDKTLEKYRIVSVNKILQLEFSNQIQPVMHTVDKSNIRISDKSDVFFDITIRNDAIVENESLITFNSPIKKAYFIDNPFIIDIMKNSKMTMAYYELNSGFERDSLLNEKIIALHEAKLISLLHNQNQPSLFEETIKNEAFKNLKNKIDMVLPGVFEFSNDGDFIVNKGKKLSLSNLATGSKFFSILKILIEKNALDENTVLILDEPESHLHPEWENVVAEIVVLLAKELGVNILLTTHSSNFMLAVDAYSKKYEFTEKSNFYQTEKTEDGFVKYNLVNDNMEKIYEDFFLPFSEMKQLRGEYSKYDA